MSWFVVAILAYFLLAVVFLVDKYLLTSLISEAKVYVFYVGILGVLFLLVIPFVDFYIPSVGSLALGLGAGVVFTLGLYWMYKTLQLFESSRVAPAIGGLTSLFTFLLVYVFSLGEERLTCYQLIAFVLLVLGTGLINFRKDKLASLKSLKFSAFTALLLALAFILTKYAFFELSFWVGLVWRSIGGILTAIVFFILYPEVRVEVFSKFKPKTGEKTSKKGMFIFLINQAAGGSGSMLQSWAIFLAPLAMVPLVHALNGVEYVFLFVFSTILSVKFPNILQEDVSRSVMIQKVIAIVLIALGLVFILW